MSENDGSADVPDDSTGVDQPETGTEIEFVIDADGRIVDDAPAEAEEEPADDGTTAIDDQDKTAGHPDVPAGARGGAKNAKPGGGGGGGGGGGRRRWMPRRRGRTDSDATSKVEINLIRTGDKRKSTNIGSGNKLIDVSGNKGIDAAGRKAPGARRRERAAAASARRAGRRSR